MNLGGKMKIPEIKPLQMFRTDDAHYGNLKVQKVTNNMTEFLPLSSVKNISNQIQTIKIQNDDLNVQKKSFSDYLIEAVNTVNSQQNEVSKLQEKVITNPDEVDIHDVTIAMSKARMSLNLAQTVIDRLVSGWNEITTTR